MRVALFILLAALAPCVASAQVPYVPLYDSGSRSTGFHFGPVTPTKTNGLDRRISGGRVIGFDAFRFLSDWFAVGADLSLFSLKSSDSEIVPGFKASQSFEPQALWFLGRANFMRHSDWSPYLSGGVGLHKIKSTFALESITPEQGSACVAKKTCGADLMRTTTSTGLGFTGALGVEKRGFLSHKLSFFTEVKLYSFPLKKASAGIGSAELYNIALGWRYWHGR